MANLIPHFIHDQYRAGRQSGRFQAATLFLDIAGFAAMTRALMEHGRDGAEAMAGLINDLFEPIIDAVYRQGGFVTTFAGDAFTAVFPYRPAESAAAVEQALATAGIISDFFAARVKTRTPLGIFPLAIRQGVAAGTIEWGIVGPAGRKSYFFKGPGIDGCSQAEERARPGETVLAPGLLALLPERPNGIQPDDQGYARLPLGGVVREPRVSWTAVPPLDPETMTAFLPRHLLPPPPQGEFREVVSVFINVNRQLTGRQLAHFVDQVIELAGSLGGFFNKLDFHGHGGTMLVLFGAPTAHESDLRRALNFALNLAQLNEEDEPFWRVGINQGPAYAGLIGSAVRSEYTALGSAVNLAARLMMKAGWGQILTPGDVTTQELFNFDYLGDVAYKGYARPVPTYRLAGHRSVEERVFAQPLVERQRELALLQEAAGRLFSDEPGQRRSGAVIIYGEAGLGKSRLSYELRKTLPDEVTWFTGQADQILRQPLNPFIYFLKNYFGQSADGDLADNAARFERRLQRLLAVLPAGTDALEEDERLGLAQELERTRSVLAALIGLPVPGSLYESLDAKGRYQNSLLAVKALLLAESCRGPVVLELEDAHWHDEASQEMVTVLTRNIAAYPLFIVLTSRYQDDGSRIDFQLAADMPCAMIELMHLSAEALQRLAEGILGGAVGPVLEQALQEKAQANPFFVQQILYFFRDNGLIFTDEAGVWQLQNESFQLPATINALLVARIDRLAGRVREVVKAAAVLGREFEVRILEQILRHDIEADVQAAAREQIWAMVSEVQVIFKHALLRDAAYNMQLGARLRQLHLLAAEAYEQVYTADLSPYYADLAYHYGLAARPLKERVYARLAGEQAAARYANKEALRFYSRALVLAEEEDWDGRYELLSAREKIYDLTGNREAHAQDLADLLTICRRRQDTLGQAAVLLRQSRHAELTSDYPAAIAVAQEALALVRPLVVEGAQAQTLYTQGQINLGTALMRQGEYAAAQKQLEEALPALDQGEAGEHLALLLIVLGGVCYYQGQYELALDYWQRAQPIYHQIGNLRGQGATFNNLGLITCDLGDYDQAQRYYEESLALKRQIGDQYGQGVTLGNLGAVFHTLGKYDQAQRHYERSLAIKRENGDRFGEGETLSDLAAIALDRKQIEQADDYLQQALATSLAIGDRHAEGRARHYLGRVAQARGQAAAAEKRLQEALALRRELNQPQYAVEDLAALADLALGENELEKAGALVEEILAYQAENPPLEGAIAPFRIFLICYRVLRLLGDPRANDLLTQGYSLLRERLVRISDPVLRERFLSGNVDHRALHDAWLDRQGN